MRFSTVLVSLTVLPEMCVLVGLAAGHSVTHNTGPLVLKDLQWSRHTADQCHLSQ